MGFAKYLDVAAVTAHYASTVMSDAATGTIGTVAGLGGVVTGEALEALGSGESEVFGVSLEGVGNYGEELADRGRSRADAGRELTNDTLREYLFLDEVGVPEFTPDGQVIDLSQHRKIESPLPGEEGVMLSARDLLNRYTAARLAGDTKSAAEWRRLYDQLTLDKAMTGSGQTGMSNPVTSALSALEAGTDINYETQFARPKSVGDDHIVESDQTPEDRASKVNIQESVIIGLLGAKFGTFAFKVIKAGNATGPALAIIGSAIAAGTISDADVSQLMLEMDFDPKLELDPSSEEEVEIEESADDLEEDTDDIESTSEDDEPDGESQDETPEEVTTSDEPKRDYNVTYDTSSQFQQAEGVSDGPW